MAVLSRLLIHSTLAGGFVLVALASACSGTAEEEGAVARPARPLPGAASPSPAEGETTPVQTVTNTGKCEELGSLVGATGTARYVNPEVRSLSLPLANRTVSSKIAVVAIGTRSALVGTDGVLGAAENANYETCTHCLVIAVGCTTDCTQGTWFYPRSGKAAFSAVPAASGESFNGTFTDVTLEEVRVDFSTGRSTIVPSGACFHVNTLSFDAIAQSETTTSDGGTTSSSSGSTSDGGSTTSSSGSTTSSSGETGSSSGGTGTSSGSGGGGKGAESVQTKVEI